MNQMVSNEGNRSKIYQSLLSSSQKQFVLLRETFVFIAIFWGKIFIENMCPCKVCAKFHVCSSFGICQRAAIWAIKGDCSKCKKEHYSYD